MGILLTLLLTRVLLALVGCQKNDLGNEFAKADSVITFAPSVAVTGNFATKGTLINTTGSDKTLTEIGEFTVSAWDNSATPVNIIPAGSKVLSRNSGAYWITVNGSNQDKEYLWKKNETKTFYAYANLPTTTGAAGITNSTATGQVLTYDVSNVATDSLQTDILMAYYSSSAPNNGLVPLKFYHPLTSVVFKQSDDFAEDVTIKSISIEGVYASGKTTQTASTGTNFVWTKTDGSAFAKADETQTVSLGSVTVDAETKQLGGALLLIPQNFASDGNARIKVVLNYRAGDLTLYYPLAGATWKAGCTNAYVINFTDGKLSIEELDKYNGCSL